MLTAIQLRLDYNEGVNIIHQRIEQVKLTNIDSITQSLWTLDSSSVQIQVNGLSRINDFIYIKITDKSNKIIAESGNINTKNIITSNIQLTKKYRDKNTLLGTLTVTATKENLYQKLISTIIVILLSQAVKTFLVSLFILAILYYLVTRHLEKISQHSTKLNLLDEPPQLILDRKKTEATDDDELANVVNSINNMSRNMHSAYNDLILNQSELADREAKFSAIFNSISDSIVVANVNREIIQINPAFTKQFGYALEDIKGKTTQLLYLNQEEYHNQGKHRFNNTAVTNSTLFEVEYKRKDGTTFPSETMGTAVNLADGNLLGYIGIIRDISERIKTDQNEQALQMQLQQAQKIEAIGQLTGGVAHDFNNILASILGYAELSILSIKEEKYTNIKNYLEQIYMSGERARDLVAQMLAFSRGQTGEPQLIYLPDLIKQVIKLIKPTIPSSINIETQIKNNVPAVLMDETQMHQIIMNLCINARDAMNGKGTLTISLVCEEDLDVRCSSCFKTVKGKYLKLTIEDTGSGIQPNVIERIFEPFMTTKEVGKGTGMGLSVIHGILHSNKSHIAVLSELNLGTRFDVLIPPATDTNITSKIVSDKKTISTNNNKHKHILLVDDEKSILLLLEKVLENNGYKVTATTSSQHAIDLFLSSEEDFDLIITDQTMPEISGIEMIKKIFEVNPNMPVVLCSGYSEHVDEKIAIEAGCSKYLTKPVKTSQLVEALHDVFEKR